MKKIINCTPHGINLWLADGTKKTFAPSGNVIRVPMKTEVVGIEDGIMFTKSVPTDEGLKGLPPQRDNTLYIVSGLVQAAAGRDDFVIPNELVRDEAGRIIGCKSFGIL